MIFRTTLDLKDFGTMPVARSRLPARMKHSLDLTDFNVSASNDIDVMAGIEV